MDNRRIIIHPCGHFEDKVLDTLMTDMNVHFGLKSELAECDMEINDYYNPSRRQYDANKIMRNISKFAINDNDKILGLLRVDLFVPILTYIFGQAELSGKSGVVSLYRLRNELYGLEHDNSLLIERFRKVAMHETGHLFGLLHCLRPGCIMRSSTYVEDIDQKDMSFCKSCAQKLEENIKID